MKTLQRSYAQFLLALAWILGVVVLSSGCVYKTYETVDETPSLESPDAGQEEDAMGIGILSKGAGKSKQLTRGQSVLPSTILNESFQDEDGKARAGVYTVQFSVRPVSGPTPNDSDHGSTITYAIITWTIGGNQIQRVVSVSNGVSVTGVGAGCSVDVYDATFVENPPDPNPDYIVVATLTPGTRGNAANPPVFIPSELDQLTGADPNGSLAPSTSSSPIPIPQNIGITSIFVMTETEDESAPIVVDLRSGAAINQASYIAKEFPTFVPIPLTATQIVITNPSGSDFQNYYIFLGIDG